MISKKLRRTTEAVFLTAGVMAFVTAASTLTAGAHETRIVGPSGQYKLVVGSAIEPPFEDQWNAAEIIISRTADNRPMTCQRDEPTAPCQGDEVNLNVEIQLRDAEAFGSAIVQAANLKEKPALTFGTTNRYHSWFRPTVNATYAYHITGEISDTSNPVAGPVTIDETFVCGKGSQAANGHGFECVADPQIFPVGHKDRHGVDKTGYEDDNSLNEFR